jgi:uncharacterized membrane protein
VTTIEKLLTTENEHMQQLNELVVEAVREEKLISQKLYEFESQTPALSGKVADKIASFGGSWKFIIFFFLFLLTWILVNVYALVATFDPYPFILLNLILSTLAAIQAPIIMMSQNRKEEKDRQRAVNDYMINLKAEIEIRNLHGKLDLLVAKQMKTLFDIQELQVQLMEEVRRLLGERQVTPEKE